MKETILTSIPIESIEIGMRVSYSKTITDTDIKAYARLSGDHNPVHLDQEYAATSLFERRIAHGLMSVGFFSALFGMRLPGPGCVYVSQNIKFKQPVFMDDTVTAIVEVTDVCVERKRVFFSTNCYVQDKLVITGDAEIYIP